MQFLNTALIMTGAGKVPRHDFRLKPGDEIRILIQGIGELLNDVR